MNATVLPLTPHLVIGGCRSGKSAYAEQLVSRFPPPYLYVATARVQDREMTERVRAHRARRGPDWQTAEAPLELAALLRNRNDRSGPVLIDCITMWITNLLLEQGPEPIRKKLAELCQALRQAERPIFLVSNEVGAGIVPENELARSFRDLAGSANQQIASACRAVTWTVAGIPVPIKPRSGALPPGRSYNEA